MDDLAGKLSELLNDPEIMKQVKGLSGTLGLTEVTSPDPDSKRQDEPLNKAPFPSLPPDTLKTLMKLAPLLSSFNKEDKYTCFLSSLRPLLSEPRKKKLDDASKLLQLIRILPLLKNQGIL